MCPDEALRVPSDGFSTVPRLVIVPALIGLLVGAIGVWLWARGEIARRNDGLAAAAEKLALVERTQEEWETHLRSLTNEALEKSSSSLLDRADERFRPIRETLDRFDEEAKKLEEQSKAAELSSEASMHVHHRWAQAITLIQIAIALAAITILTRNRGLQVVAYVTAGGAMVIGALALAHI